MNVFVKVLIVTMGSLLALPVFADAVTDEFGQCMTDALTGKERKMLAKWIFFSVAAHPDIKVYSNITEKDIQASDEYVGKLVTRLLTEDCPNEFVKANNTNPQALKNAFALVGRVAMQELMAHPDVTKSISSYAQYADQNKINALMNKKK